MKRPEWKVSLHGGHSRAYCDHAQDPLTAMLDAAAERGYHTFGVTEHAPRLGEQYLYDQEIALGWDAAKIERDFEMYCRDIVRVPDCHGSMVVLRGFETESVPDGSYLELMKAYRQRPCFDFCVGSIHFLRDISIDGPRAAFDRALHEFGGLESLAVAYYEKVGEMADALKPEVIGHFDLIRKNGQALGPVDTERIRAAAHRALEAVQRNACILDLNTAGYRKGLGTPYPAPWIIHLASEMGIGFCFGDDSHSVADVGAGIDEARRYLMENGVDSVAVLTREGGRIVKKHASLEG